MARATEIITSTTCLLLPRLCVQLLWTSWRNYGATSCHCMSFYNDTRLYMPVGTLEINCNKTAQNSENSENMLYIYIYPIPQLKTTWNPPNPQKNGALGNWQFWISFVFFWKLYFGNQHSTDVYQPYPEASGFHLASTLLRFFFCRLWLKCHFCFLVSAATKNGEQQKNGAQPRGKQFAKICVPIVKISRFHTNFIFFCHVNIATWWIWLPFRFNTTWQVPIWRKVVFSLCQETDFKLLGWWVSYIGLKWAYTTTRLLKFIFVVQSHQNTNFPKPADIIQSY